MSEQKQLKLTVHKTFKTKKLALRVLLALIKNYNTTPHYFPSYGAINSTAELQP